jgi:hypothetical protein
MWLSSLLAVLKGSAGRSGQAQRRRAGRGKPAAPRRSFRPQLESLDERIGPSAICNRLDSLAPLFTVRAAFQEMQQSFNLQYLTLQNQIQSENRQFCLMSNIMETRHDTAQNSISNLR